MKTKIGVVSLGCDKNRVDTEIMLSNLAAAGYEITPEPYEAEIIIVNTCAFIEPARKESVDTIFEMSRFKKGNCKKLVVTGCFPQKYIKELEEEFHEVDVFCGTDACGRIVEILESEKRNNVAAQSDCVHEGARTLTTAAHYAYLRIADGCDNHCTYCLIPSIRGRYRSRQIESILSEAEALVKSGVKELILIAQDVTRYGYDFDGEAHLCELIRKLSLIPEIKWIRLLYCYPELVDDELINEIASNPKVVKYLDIPLQHSESRILKLMGRRSDRQGLDALFAKLKTKIPGIALRTTFIVGFPSETEKEFSDLKEFAQAQKFFNAGFFMFSKEDGTAAANLKNQLPQSVKKRRLDEIARTQFEIVKENNSSLIGKEILVVIDSFVERTGIKNVYSARSYMQAPDIDGVIFVETERILETGGFYKIKITDFEGYDLVGEY